MLDGGKLSFTNLVLQEFQSVYECIDKINHFMSRAAIMSFVPLLSKILPESISKVNSTFNVQRKQISKQILLLFVLTKVVLFLPDGEGSILSKSFRCYL